MSRVVSLWFPTLPTDRLRANRQAPVDGPLVTAAAEQGRRVVASASREALRAGVRIGQPLAEARVLVAGLVVMEADLRADAALLRRIAIHAARRWTPLVAIDGKDGLFLDVTASAHLFALVPAEPIGIRKHRAWQPGMARRAARTEHETADQLLLQTGYRSLAGENEDETGETQLLRRIARTARRLGLAPRAAIADTPAAAWALARHARTPLTIVPPGADRSAIAPLPSVALRLAPATVDTLHRLGFDHAGPILAAPRAPLVRRFGADFAIRLAQIEGSRAEPIALLIPPSVPHARRELLEPIATPEAIAGVIEDLATDLCDILEARRQGLRQILLVCRRVDARDETVTIGLARPSRDPAHLADLLRRRIETIDPGFGIEAMTLAATRIQALLPEQATGRLAPATRAPGNIVAFPGTRPRIPAAEREEPDLAALIDRLVTRFGLPAVYRVAPAQSDVPTRSVLRLAPLAPPTAHDWRADWPRPPRLLARAEGARVTALLPDHGPRQFVWRGRQHRVVASDGPERLHGEWWRGGEPYAVRDYFQVEVEGGGRYWLFRRGDGDDPATGKGDWYVHGAFG